MVNFIFLTLVFAFLGLDSVFSWLLERERDPVDLALTLVADDLVRDFVTLATGDLLRAREFEVLAPGDLLLGRDFEILARELETLASRSAAAASVVFLLFVFFLSVAPEDVFTSLTFLGFVGSDGELDRIRFFVFVPDFSFLSLLLSSCDREIATSHRDKQ